LNIGYSTCYMSRFFSVSELRVVRYGILKKGCHSIFPSRTHSQFIHLSVSLNVTTDWLVGLFILGLPTRACNQAASCSGVILRAVHFINDELHNLYS
jgi:hypothetical protein